MRLPTLLSIVLLLALWVVSAALYPGLPAQLPMHFDFAGHANRWAPRSFGTWFLIPLVGLATAMFTLALMYFLPRIPVDLINIPRKDEFLRLTPPQRAEVLGVVQGAMGWISACVVAMCAILQYAVYETANGRAATAILRVVEFGPVLVISLLVLQMWFNVRQAIGEHSV